MRISPQLKRLIETFDESDKRLSPGYNEKKFSYMLAMHFLDIVEAGLLDFNLPIE